MKNEKQQNTKNTAIGCLGFVVIVLALAFAFTSCGKKTSSEPDDIDIKAAVITSTESVLEEKARISEFKMKDSSVEVTKEPNYKDSKTNNIYKNVYYCKGKYSWQGMIYNYTALYSYTNSKLEKYYTLQFSTDVNGGSSFKNPDAVKVE